MTVERSQSAENAANARLQERQKGPDGTPPPREQVDQFRQALRQAGQGQEFLQARQQQGGELQVDLRAELRMAAEAAARQGGENTGRVEALQSHGGDAGDTGSSGNLQQMLDSSDLIAMMQSQSALRDGAMMPTPPAAPAAAGTFADLVERHVRQLAVNGGAGADAADGQVLLRMSDAALPGTDLLLSKTETGWLLKADTRSRGSYDAIREAAPELARRFAARDLGTLEVEPQLHG